MDASAVDVSHFTSTKTDAGPAIFKYIVDGDDWLTREVDVGAIT